MAFGNHLRFSENQQQLRSFEDNITFTLNFLKFSIRSNIQLKFPNRLNYGEEIWELSLFARPNSLARK